MPCVGILRLCGYAAISAETHGVVTSETIRRAFCATEEGFTNLVSELWSSRPQMATVGSCCLVGVIYQQTLFVANLGDSRVVLGKKVGNTGGIAAIQLSTEHNANLEVIRHELKNLHPNDPQIVVLKHGVWRVKGIIQVISNPNLTFRIFQIKTPLRCFCILVFFCTLGVINYETTWWAGIFTVLGCLSFGIHNSCPDFFQEVVNFVVAVNAKPNLPVAIQLFLKQFV